MADTKYVPKMRRPRIFDEVDSLRRKQCELFGGLEKDARLTLDDWKLMLKVQIDKLESVNDRDRFLHIATTAIAAIELADLQNPQKD